MLWLGFRSATSLAAPGSGLLRPASTKAASARRHLRSIRLSSHAVPPSSLAASLGSSPPTISDKNTQQLSRSPSSIRPYEACVLGTVGQTSEEGKDPSCRCWRWSRCAEAVIKASLVCAHTRPGAGSQEAPLRCPSVNALSPSSMMPHTQR